MTTRTRTKIFCSRCGNEGLMTITENDAPFSKMYESYSFEGFTGGGYFDGFCKSYKLLKARCMKCNHPWE
jgi:hypothetical protein